MKPAHIDVVLTQDYKLKPLASVDLPGLGAELTPAQMRGLAKALIAAAAECEARSMTKRGFMRAKRKYDVEGGAR